MQKHNYKDGSEDNKTLYSAKLWKNTVYAFLLIPTLGKRGQTLLVMKIQTASVRTWSFVHFNTVDLFTNKAQFHTFSRNTETKRQYCAKYIDLTVMFS